MATTYKIVGDVPLYGGKRYRVLRYDDGETCVWVNVAGRAGRARTWRRLSESGKRAQERAAVLAQVGADNG
jgi:hypothetical protein